MPTKDNLLIIGIVGPCGSGKSTLIRELQRVHAPCEPHHIAQEHSFVQNMWQRMVHPDVLIFLDASFRVSQQRRHLDWSEADYLEQQRRLSHARQNANLYLFTDLMTPDDVLQKVLDFLGFSNP